MRGGRRRGERVRLADPQATEGVPGLALAQRFPQPHQVGDAQRTVEQAIARTARFPQMKRP
jgi:hypothetical protein